MATYQELFELRSNSALRNRIAVAAAKKAQSLLDGGTPTTEEVAWANNAISEPIEIANKLMVYVLAANSAATVAAINAVTDAALQTAVDGAVDALIAGGITN